MSIGDRTRIRSEIGNPEYVFRQVHEHLQAPERATALYEILWRLDLAFVPPSVWFRGVLTELVEDSSSIVKKRQRFEIALILLRIAREERDRSLFERWVIFLKRIPALTRMSLQRLPMRRVCGLAII